MCPQQLPGTDAATQALAQLIAEARVPVEVRRQARRYVVDWLGSTLAGGGEPELGAVRTVVTALGGRPAATALCAGERTTAPLAALVNGAAAHVIELDDLDRDSITHPAAPIISAAFAVAEQRGCDWDTLLDAVVIGYEVALRVGEALGPSHYELWHTTATAGVLGAAAACSRAMGLDATRSLHALGSAATMAAGLWQFLVDGAMSKPLHAGKAAHDGVIAALLAEAGLSGASRALEGSRGMLRAMSEQPRPERLTEGLEHLLGGASKSAPMRWRIGRVSFKVHACCRHTHAAIDALLALREEHGLEPERVRRVHVALYSQGAALVSSTTPDSPHAAKFSLPFCIALALTHGDVGPSRFSTSALVDPRLTQLASRIDLRVDPELDARYPEQWPAVIEVELSAGQRLGRRVDHPRGDPEVPLSSEDLLRKVELLLPALWGRELRTLMQGVLDGEHSATPQALAGRLRELVIALGDRRSG